MKSKYLCARCKVKSCSGYVESSTNPLETFHFCPKFVFDDGTPFSHADRIRSMNDKELAEFIRSIETARCYIIINGFEIYNSDSNNLEEWLESEVVNE